MSVDELPGAKSLRITVLLGAALDDVEDGRDVGGGSILELVFAQRVSSRNGLTIDVLVPWSFHAEGGFVVESRLHSGIFEGHLGSLLGNFSGRKERAEFLSKICDGRADKMTKMMNRILAVPTLVSFVMRFPGFG